MPNLIAFLGAMLLAGAANAQPAIVYPDKPVRLVVAFAPGGIADVVARFIGQKLGDAWGQPLVIENRGGAAGSIATKLVAKAAPDGYTVLINTSAYVVAPGLNKDAGYDPEKDLVPVMNVASSPNMIVVNPGIAANTLKDAMALAKTGKLNYGTAGAGTTPHLSAEYLFRILAGVNIVHIPYPGAGPALNAVMGGQVELGSVALAPAVPLVRSGKVRALAVSSAKRVAALPDVPTIAESGYPGFEDNTWVGLFVPVGTPPAIVDRLNAAVAAVLAQPDLKERLAGLGFEPDGGSPGEFARYISAEVRKWAKVIRETGARAE